MTFADMWERKRKETDRIKRLRWCVLSWRRGHVNVECPDGVLDNDPETIKLGGKYRKRTGRWTFGGSKYHELLKMCNRLFPGKVREMAQKKAITGSLRNATGSHKGIAPPDSGPV